MKKMLLSAVVLAGLPLYAATGDTAAKDQAQVITFKNDNTEPIQLRIRDQKTGADVKTTQLSTGQSAKFTLQPDQQYTIQAEELGGHKLKTGIQNIFLRSRYTEGDVTISKTTLALGRRDKLVVTGQNVVIQAPRVRPDWAKPEDMPPKAAKKSKKQK